MPDPASLPVPPLPRGRAGEAIAALFLESRGWTVLARNFRAGRHELDLVVARGATLACVEVKWRRADTPFAAATASWSPGQRRRAATAAWAAVAAFDPGHERQARFDLVTIDETPRGLVLVHHPATWSPATAWW